VTRVRVVVVNHNGGDLTVDCLRRLVATRWRADSLEIVLVDNASDDDVVARVRAELPVVTVVVTLRSRNWRMSPGIRLIENRSVGVTARPRGGGRGARGASSRCSMHRI